jgi:hypothetical protein
LLLVGVEVAVKILLRDLVAVGVPVVIERLLGFQFLLALRTL